MDKESLVGKQISHFSFIKLLGSGNFSSVYEAIDQRNKNIIAIKVLDKEKIREHPKLEQLLKSEITVLKKCKNENVIGFISSFKSENSLFIATQFCNGGDLDQYLRKKRRLTEDQATDFLKQILNGFKGLHEVEAMHRDFKSANVLLHNNQCKIADLGFCKQMEKSKLTETLLGTAVTMAPQILWKKPYGYKADIWSIGVVYYQMLFGRYPFIGQNEKDILKKINKDRPNYSGVNISDEAKHFIQCCLTIEPSERISWEQIYQHPLLAQEEKPSIFHTIQSKSQKIVTSNIDFYRKTDFQKKKHTNFQEKEMKTQEGKIQMEDVGEQKKIQNMDSIIEEVNSFKQKEQDFKYLQKQYLDKRNNCMFIYKFICPYLTAFSKQYAHHGIYLFIISKKTFLDILELKTNMQERRNIFKYKSNFQEFMDSKEYKNILQQVKTDEELVRLQSVQYCSIISSCSEQIGAQFDLETVYSSNFDKLVKSLVNDYWFLLAETMNKVEGHQKQKLIRVLQALKYYEANKQVDTEQFDIHMGNVDLNDIEQEIKKKLQYAF